ncbi:MAG: pseudaminic acid synthase [Planctomycetota bacterium]|nr:MAG: pseudaminic acid synthase [Planctomycetota bacterium]
MTNSNKFLIGNRNIGQGSPVYIIAEMSGNHNGQYERALELIRAAKESGADAVKLQTYNADTMTIKSNKEHFKVSGGSLWDGEFLYDLYEKAMTPWDWQPKLIEEANKLGMDCFSTPFDKSSLEFLEAYNPVAYKVASFELVDIPLIKAIASKGKPMILSTGMASIEEIEEAVKALRENGCKEFSLLKCVSNYPAKSEDMHLNTISDLAQRFQCVVGLSDHSMDLAVPITAVALGASIIEKHLTLDRKEGGVDSAFSLEPAEFKLMVENVRIAEKALGGVSYRSTESERKSLCYRRSIFIVKDIKKGDVLTEENIRCIRPGQGLSPKYFDEVLGKKVTCDLERGEPLLRENIL